MLEDIEEVISRLRPGTASRRIAMEYIELKEIENAEEKAAEKFLLKLSVETSSELDTENNPFRLMARSSLLYKNWNISEIYFRQQDNDLPPQLNFKDITRFAAAEEYFKGGEYPANNFKENDCNKIPNKGYVCQIFIKVIFLPDLEARIKVLWKLPYDDFEEELDLYPCEDSAIVMQTRSPIRVLQGKFSWENNTF